MTIRALVAASALLALQQAPAPQTPPARPVPLAANTLAANLEAFSGQTVSITAAVDRILSPTIVLVDQDINKNSPQGVVVIIPAINAPVEVNAYYTIVGVAVRFDAAYVAKRAPGYKVDLAPEVMARYEGRPAIIATTMVNAALVDLARRMPPPMTPAEEAFDKAMKQIGPAFNDLRTAMGASDAKAAAASAKILTAAFGEADTFWRGRANADAIDWNRTARAHLTVLEKAVAAGKWDQVKTSVADVQRLCSSCHAAYRERLEDGSYRVKAAPAR